MGKGRLEAFTDGVVAIIITIMRWSGTHDRRIRPESASGGNLTLVTGRTLSARKSK
jgi:hypothetical protein